MDFIISIEDIEEKLSGDIKGEVLTEEDLYIKTSGDGISIIKWNEVLEWKKSNKRF